MGAQANDTLPALALALAAQGSCQPPLPCPLEAPSYISSTPMARQLVPCFNVYEWHSLVVECVELVAFVC